MRRTVEPALAREAGRAGPGSRARPSRRATPSARRRAGALGAAASAMARCARCRSPPDSRCGYASSAAFRIGKGDLGQGARRQARAPRLATPASADGSPPRSRSPIVRTGSSADAGSWKTRPISAPRTDCHSPSARPRRSRPSKRIAPADARTRRGERPRSARASCVLPLPALADDRDGLARARARRRRRRRPGASGPRREARRAGPPPGGGVRAGTDGGPRASGARPGTRPRTLSRSSERPRGRERAGRRRGSSRSGRRPPGTSCRPMSVSPVSW